MSTARPRTKSTAQRLASLQADLAPAAPAPATATAAAPPPPRAEPAPTTPNAAGAVHSVAAPTVADVEAELRGLVRAHPLTAAGLALLAGVAGGLLIRGSKR